MRLPCGLCTPLSHGFSLKPRHAPVSPHISQILLILLETNSAVATPLEDYKPSDDFLSEDHISTLLSIAPLTCVYGPILERIGTLGAHPNRKFLED